MKTKTHIKAGAMNQHNETLVRTTRPAPRLTLKTHVKAGGLTQHNETLVQATSRQRSRV